MFTLRCKSLYSYTTIFLCFAGRGTIIINTGIKIADLIKVTVVNKRTHKFGKVLRSVKSLSVFI